MVAFLLTRTDLVGRRWLEPLVLMPMFLSAIVLAFGCHAERIEQGQWRLLRQLRRQPSRSEDGADAGGAKFARPSRDPKDPRA